ncbi:cadherin EGF LAG seven-pass G-type receptor 2-like isoform X1 [Lethenteron reissneri]|uniref:cadherin EGF LAG seven-pass G-type receptor 2-like isoform X1 n=1 Tax=Lethenteron reissneri TaxID=7753 RepID=UPI002AB7B46D|nr:cadherin EGF LAG seven-pass G-type receptor 2-like isoform X1 [Lethenteron reissneri]
MYRKNVILFVLTIFAVADVTSAQADGLEFQSLKASYDLVENSPPATTVATFQVVANVSVAQSLLTTRIEAIVPAFIRLKPLISGPIKSGSVVTYDVQLVLDTGSSVDFEASELYTVSISISAAGGAVQKSATLQLRILNVNEPPSCENAFVQGVTVSIPENAPNGQNVYKVVAPDPEKDALFFDIVSQIPPGGPKGYFTINPASGAVERSSLSPLDYEANLRVVHLNITVREVSTQQQFTCAGSLTVNILDTNDEPPIISPLPFTQTNFAEEQPPGTPVLQVTATDRDAGDTQTYAFADTTPDAFTIAAGSGVITSSRKLDYDDALTPKFYILSIRVYDKGRTNTATATLSVFLVPVNEAPTCTPIQGNGAVANITENFRPSQTIFRVTAVDPDAGDLLTYSISNQVPPLASAEYFSIDSSSGVISRTNLVPLDYEGNFKVFLISLTITDNGSPRRSCTGRITVNLIDTNDEPPIFELVVPNPMEILEDQPPGTVITQMKATDRDAGDIVSFELASPSTAFAVDADSGIVYTQMSLDYDDAKIPKKHVLIIFAYDSGRQNVATYNLTLLLQPVNEAPACDPLFAREDGAITRTAENVFPLTAIYKVTANDPDNGDILKYDILSQAPNVSGVGYFSINSFSGVIYRSSLTPLDFDAGLKVFQITVNVTDNGLPRKSCRGMVTVFIEDVNDETPQITSDPADVAHVAEEQPPGTVVAQLHASDRDANDTATFEFVGNEDSFNIETGTGTVSTSKRLNYDDPLTPREYLLSIRACDKNRTHSATLTLTVILDPINEPPQCDPAFSQNTGAETVIFEDHPIFKPIYKLVASDPDIDDTLIFKITEQRPNLTAASGFFSVDPASGIVALTAKEQLNYDTGWKVFKLSLRVEEANKIAPLFCLGTLTIFVHNINDETPNIRPFISNPVSVPDTTSPGKVISKVTAVDLDENDGVFFEFIDEYKGFNIDPESGVITAAPSWERMNLDAPKSYELRIRVHDVGRIHSATTTLTVSVMDTNNNPPQCSQYVHYVSLPETAPVGGLVAQLSCWDRDGSAPNNQLLYSMQLDVSARDRFQSSGDEILIGSAGLQCDTASVANLEFKHTILMVVRDGGYPSLSTTVTVVVSVTSVNEFEPSPKNVQFSVREDSPVGALVGTVIGQDQDWPFDSLRYSIVGGNEDKPAKVLH